MAIGQVINDAIPQGSTVGLIILLIVFGLASLIIFGGLGWYIYNKRRWNLKIEIKLPRSDGRIVNSEWGRGYFHSKRGVVYIRRPGAMQPKIPLRIFDPKRYLQGSDTLTVVQLSPTDYRPVLPKSFLEYDVDYELEEDCEEGKAGEIVTVKEGVLEMECDSGHDKAWQVSFEEASKKAYSLQSFLQQFQTPIAIAIVLVAVFVGIAALWSQMPG